MDNTLENSVNPPVRCSSEHLSKPVETVGVEVGKAKEGHSDHGVLTSDSVLQGPSPLERLAPRAAVDSFSDDDFDLCIVPSEVPTDARTFDDDVRTEIPVECDHVVEDSFEHLVGLEQTNDSINLSDIVLANTSQTLETETVCNPLNVEKTAGVHCEAVVEKSVDTNMTEGVSSDHSRSACERLLALAAHEEDSGKVRVDKEKLAGHVGGLQDTVASVQTSVVGQTPVVETDVDVGTQCVSSLSLNESCGCSRSVLDPLSRIDLLLESLSSHKVTSPAGLHSVTLPELKQLIMCSSTLLTFCQKPSELSDSNSVNRSKDNNNVSKVIVFNVADDSGVTKSFTVDESFVNDRRCQRQLHQISDNDSSTSDVSLSGVEPS
jgi:hypothetical protein